MGFLLNRLAKLKDDLRRGRAHPEAVKKELGEAVQQAKGIAEVEISLLEASRAEAAQQYLAKMAKIESGHAALGLDHMATLAEDEEDTVRRYREKKLFGGDGASTAAATEAKGMGRSLILADNITYHDPAPPPQPAPQPTSSNSSMLPWLLAAGMAAGGAGLLGGYLLTKDKDQTPVVEKKVETPTGTTTTTVKGVGSTVELVQPK